MLFCFAFLIFSFSYSSASRLSGVSDKIGKSWPSASSTHEIKFVLINGVPANGKIVITPEINYFNIPSGFDYTDVDFAVANDYLGPFSERALAPFLTADEDGVEVVSGSQGSIKININSSVGISSGMTVRIRLGENTNFGEQGDINIINPGNIGSYKINIQTYNELNNPLDNSDAVIAVISPISMGITMPRIRSNGSPSGVLIAGTTQTVLSLLTNHEGICRYSTASNTPYSSMVYTFINDGGVFHSIVISGLENNNHYNYYVRCEYGENIVDTDDYIISFSIEAEGGSGGGTGGGDGGGTGAGTGPGTETGRGGGGGGGGSGGGTGSGVGPGSGEMDPYPLPPALPNLTLTGWAYPNSKVNIIKDGKEIKSINADVIAKFSVDISDLKEGVYTFGLYGIDNEGRKSSTYTTTFWIKSDSKTVISDIIIPPTIELNKNTIKAGETISIIGQGVPKSTIEAWLYKDEAGGVKEENVIKKESVVGDTGKWNLFYPTDDLSTGVYKVKARIYTEFNEYSNFSHILDVGVGQEVPQTVCSGADLNKDGKVNLTDFSILLYYWNTNNACADQNKDGKVNLIDFSIMLFNWTG